MAELPSHKSMLGNGGESLEFLSFPQRLQKRKQTKTPAEGIQVAQGRNFRTARGLCWSDDLHAYFCSPAGPHQPWPCSAPLRPSQWPPLGRRKHQYRGLTFRPYLPLQETPWVIRSHATCKAGSGRLQPRARANLLTLASPSPSTLASSRGRAPAFYS